MTTYSRATEAAVLGDLAVPDDITIAPRAELKPTDRVIVRPQSCSVHRGKVGVIRSTTEPGRLSVLVVFPPAPGGGQQIMARFAPGELRRQPRP